MFNKRIQDYSPSLARLRHFKYYLTILYIYLIPFTILSLGFHSFVGEIKLGDRYNNILIIMPVR